MAIFYFFLFFIGTTIGSFYITLAYRILRYFYSKERKIFTFTQKLYRIFIYQNECDSCHIKISYLHVIPVIGYFIAQKKCSNCKKPIPPIFPIIEFIFGLLIMLAFYLSHNFYITFLFIFLCGHLLISAITDWRYFSLDYENLLFIILLGFSLLFMIDAEFSIAILYIYFGFLAFYLFLWYFFRQSIGFGDVIFSPFYAAIAGHPWWIMYLNLSYAAALISALLFRKKNESLKRKVIPMGTFLSLGLILTILGKLFFLYRESL